MNFYGSTISANSARTSSRLETTTVTVTFIENGSVTTVFVNGTETTIYENGTTTVYENYTATTLTETLIQTVTVTSSNSTITSTISGSTACSIFGGSGTPVYCVPVIISNGQSSATSPNTQILLNVDWNAYSSHLAPNVGNVVFTDASGDPLMRGANQIAEILEDSSNVWIKDNATIQPYSQRLMFMYIFPVSSIQYQQTRDTGARPRL